MAETRGCTGAGDDDGDEAGEWRDDTQPSLPPAREQQGADGSAACPGQRHRQRVHRAAGPATGTADAGGTRRRWRPTSQPETMAAAGVSAESSAAPRTASGPARISQPVAPAIETMTAATARSSTLRATTSRSAAHTHP